MNVQAGLYISADSLPFQVVPIAFQKIERELHGGG